MWKSDQHTSLLRQLHALNRNFIEYLLDDGEARSSVEPIGAPDFAAPLRALKPAALRAVCANPYSLYHLPFSNAIYWRESAALAVSSAEPRPHNNNATEHLTKLALFFAWHVACTHAATARLFFGMSAGTLEFFRRADVATLSDMAVPAATVLQPRWPGNPHFWPDLLRYAGTDRVRMHATRLLGAQLLASELHGEHMHVVQPSRRLLSVRVRPRALARKPPNCVVDKPAPLPL